MDLKKEPINQLIKKIAIPSMTGLFFMTLYNVVDTYFAGKFSVEALSALSITFPIFFIIISFSAGIASATTALIGNALGDNDVKKANFVLRQSISLSLIVSIILIISYLLLSDVLFTLLGAEGIQLELAKQYIDPLFYACPIVLIVTSLNSAFAARGLTKYYRNSLIFSFFLNLILDPWFIFGGFGIPPMEVRGIAYSTIISQFCTLIYISYKIYKKDIFSAFRIEKCSPDKKVFREILSQSIPSVLSMGNILFFFFITFYFVNNFGIEASAAYGIGLRIEQIVLIPTLAINSAVLSIVSQSFGNGNIKRVLEIRKKGLYYSLFISFAGAILIFVFSNYIITFFTDDVKVIKYGLSYINVEVLVLLAYSFVHINGAILQGIKKPNIILQYSIIRLIIFPIIIMYICIELLKLNIESIWWTIFVCNWFVGIVLHFIVKSKLLKLKKQNPILTTNKVK